MPILQQQLLLLAPLLPASLEELGHELVFLRLGHVLFVLLLPVRGHTGGSHPVTHRYLDEAFSFWHAARYTAQEDNDGKEQEQEQEENGKE